MSGTLKNQISSRTIASYAKLCRVHSGCYGFPSNIQEFFVSDTLIYTHPDCAYSSAAKMDYRKRKIEYTEIDLSKKADQIPALLELTNGERVTPVIVEDGVVTIGFKGGT